MLPSKQRLSRKEFDVVHVRGRFFRGSLCSFRVVKKIEGELRVGVVVSKKVSKLAPNRNLIKRRVHAVLKEVGGVLAAPVDIIVYLHPKQQSYLFTCLKKDILNALSKKGYV